MHKLIIMTTLAGALATAYYVVECIDAASNLVQQSYHVSY